MELLTLLFLAVSVSGLPPKHVYISTPMTWAEAQANCRELYTDLSAITSAEEDEMFKQSDEQYGNVWIGLYREEGLDLWMWSGAGPAGYNNVLPKYSETNDSYLTYKYGVWTMHGWMALRDYDRFSSFCSSLILVDQRMSWEDALTYCRGRHTDLTSLLSDTDTQLALGKLQPEHVSERVWIGLRFLEDRWMWMSGEALTYTAWAQDGDCPQGGRCGAVNKAGLWEDWDCNDKLNFICQ